MVTSAVAIPAGSAFGSQPSGNLSLWLVRSWGQEYKIGQAYLQNGQKATFQEPSFVRPGRELDVYFDGSPAAVWSNSSMSTESC
jgi:hypothetical protein